MASTITYVDKIDLNTTAVADANKVKASDLNEIKSVVNANAGELTNAGTYSTTEVNTGLITNQYIERSYHLQQVLH